MGYWNATCGLSDLPICIGEKVCAVIIEQMRQPARSCYSAENWCPVGPAIWGTYNGYGYLEDLQDEAAFEANLRLVQDNIIVKDMQEFKYEGVDMFFTALNDEQLFSMHEGPTHLLQLVLFKEESVAMANQNPRFTEFLQRDGISEQSPLFGAYGMRSKLLKKFAKQKADLLDVAAIDIALRTLRRSWQPTSGCGSQTEIEEDWQADWYRMVADSAKDSLLEYNFSLNY